MVSIASVRTAETASIVSSAFTMVGLVTAWVLLQMLVLGGLSHERSQDLLYDQFRSELASGTAPLGPEISVGDPVALVSIPAIDLQQVVVEGTAGGDLLAGPGHRRDTVLPGQTGVSIIHGRAATYGGPFEEVPTLRPGAIVTVTTAQGEKQFSVLGVRREGDPVPALAGGAARITLVTAEGEGRLGRYRPGRTVYVDAEAGSAYPTPARMRVQVPPSEVAMGIDTGALALLSLCLAALVALTLGVIAACQRWSTWLVWVIAAPVVITLSWMTTDVVMRLLPNLV